MQGYGYVFAEGDNAAKIKRKKGFICNNNFFINSDSNLFY